MYAGFFLAPNDRGCDYRTNILYDFTGYNTNATALLRERDGWKNRVDR